jgi:hypothetical protein
MFSRYSIDKNNITNINKSLKNIPITILNTMNKQSSELFLKIIPGISKYSVPTFFFTNKYDNAFININNIGTKIDKYIIETDNIRLINENLKNVPIKIINNDTQQVSEYFFFINNNEYFFITKMNEEYIKLKEIMII